MKKNTIRLYYTLMVIGGLMGAIASFMQLIEKIHILKNPSSNLICNINEVINCTNVLNAPQSSVFGFPNAMMSLVLFVLFFSIGLVGISGGNISKWLKNIIFFLSLFTLGFGSWFLWQSTFVIGSICLYCIVNFLGLILVNLGLFRVIIVEYRNKTSHNKLTDSIVGYNLDFIFWGLYCLLVLSTIYFKLGLN